MKLVEKVRINSKCRKKYDAPQTPSPPIAYVVYTGDIVNTFGISDWIVQQERIAETFFSKGGTWAMPWNKGYITAQW